MACFGRVNENQEQIQTADVQNEYKPTLPPVEEDGTLALRKLRPWTRG
jgi:hypothetical protein